MGERQPMVGGKLAVGAAAPALALDRLDPEDSAVHTVRLEDTTGRVAHAEYVADQMTEPDYGAAAAWSAL